MSFTSKDTESVESLVDNLDIDPSSLVQTNLSGLSSNDLVSDLAQLAELSEDLSSEMEHEDTEMSTIENEDGDDEPEDIEMELEKPELVPPIEIKKSALPPLRPLTIAPKPSKVPFTIKNVAGQQLVLLQGGTGGQQIKLVSPHGQGISLSNLSLGKPVTIKSAVKSGNTLSSIQPKQIVMKKVVQQVQKSALGKNTFDTKSGQQIVVVQKSDPQLKLVQAGGSSAPTKTLTLAQAQQMGIITSGTKLVPQGGTKQIVLNKNQSKTIKIVPQMRSPTKILPAPNNQAGKMAQRIILKPAGGGNSGTIMPSQIIQVTGTQGMNAGQLHQINIPGKGMQYIKFITTSQHDASTSSVGTLQTLTTRTSTLGKVGTVTSSAGLKSGMMLSELKTIGKPTTISKTLKSTPTTTTIRPVNINVGSNLEQVMVLPASYLPRNSSMKVAIPAMRHTTPVISKLSTTNAQNSQQPTGDAVVPSQTQSSELNLESSNGMRPRKPCNCTKSQCLKLYCDCFANGEFCYMCNCMNCFNNLENEEHRQRAIKNCLERNPNAFRPKIGKAKDTNDAAIRKHTKGCNCKRSGCLKNYCECYEAKIACSSNCKCMGCRNIEDSMDKKSRSSILSESSFSTSPQPSMKNSFSGSSEAARLKKGAATNKQAFNYITNAVIEATSQCLLTLSDNAEETEQDEETTKKQIIEEFSRCLRQIIECSITKNQYSKTN